MQLSSARESSGVKHSTLAANAVTDFLLILPWTPEARASKRVLARARWTRPRSSAMRRRLGHAVDDVAAVFRTLLAHGKGDDASVRLCRI